MLRHLLDTHAILWTLEDNVRLGQAARKIVTQAVSHELAISAISLLEISMLIEKGRIHLEIASFDFLKRIETTFTVIPLDALIANDAMKIPLSHGDPFDRVIVATARSQGLSLLTKDRAITDSGLVPVIW